MIFDRDHEAPNDRKDPPKRHRYPGLGPARPKGKEIFTTKDLARQNRDQIKDQDPEI